MRESQEKFPPVGSEQTEEFQQIPTDILVGGFNLFEKY